jgi:hypothetical protein
MADRVLRALPEEGPGVTESELGELLGQGGRKTVEPLRGLLASGEVERGGGGRRGWGRNGAPRHAILDDDFEEGAA